MQCSILLHDSLHLLVLAGRHPVLLVGSVSNHLSSSYSVPNVQSTKFGCSGRTKSSTTTSNDGHVPLA